MGRSAVRAFGLFGLLIALYFATFTGHPVSGDEQIMFDGAHSFYRNGSFELAYFNELRPYFPVQPGRIVLQMDVEPMQSYAAAFLIWIAAQLPSIGLIHAAWTLNLFVTALSAVILYDMGKTLRYSDNVALSVALLYGLATTAWPYSTMFFREPLFTLFILLCSDSLLHWKHATGKSQLFWLLLGVAAFASALLTKGIALLVLPAMCIQLSGKFSRHQIKWLIVVCLSVALFALCLFALYAVIAPGVRFRYSLIWLANIDLSNVFIALSAWLVSPGFSIWIFSPILVLGLGGAYQLFRRKQWRDLLFPLVLSITLMLGYAILQGRGWYSGLGWGPRYLVPLVPFLMLWLLPIMAKFPRYPRGIKMIIGALVGISVSVQLIAVLVPTETFGTVLANLSMNAPQPIVPWRDGVWSLQYSSLVVDLTQLGRVPSQIAWIVMNEKTMLMALFLPTVGISCLAILGKRMASLMVLPAVTVMLYIGLTTLYADVRLGGRSVDLWQALTQIKVELRPTDAILLDNSVYRDFFANFYKGHSPIYVLPNTPPSPSQSEIESPDGYVHPYLWTLLSRLALHTSRWWFVTQRSSDVASSPRVNDDFLAYHFFPATQTRYSSSLNVWQFAPYRAPSAEISPRNSYDVDFGAARLEGYDLPFGREFKAGDIIPISLLWKHQPWPADLQPFDYGINISLLDKNGKMVAQQAGVPAGSFGLMSRWKPGQVYRDNHALILPPNLVPGTYMLWVSVYDWRTVANLIVRNSDAPTDHIVIGEVVIFGLAGGNGG